jgi:hypothetical protein
MAMSCPFWHSSCKVVASSCTCFCHCIQWPYTMSCIIATNVTCSMQLTLYFYNELQMVIATRNAIASLVAKPTFFSKCLVEKTT